MAHLKCVICFEKYDAEARRPLMLQCGHSFCKDCLVRIDNHVAITCPSCRLDDHRSIDRLPVNYALRDGIEEMSRKQNKGSVQVNEGLKQVKDKVGHLINSIDILSSRADAEERNTTQQVKNDFEQLRTLLLNSEQAALNRVASTHAEIRTQLNEAKAKVQLLQSRVLSGADSLQRSAQDMEREAVSVKTLKELVESLPVKVSIDTSNFDFWLNTHVKILDQTNVSPSELEATFIRDVTIDDGAEMPQNFTFNKIWRIQNSGNQPWPEGCWCVFTEGDFSGISTIVSSAWPQEAVDVSVVCTSPHSSGKARSYWRLVDPEGRVFGPTLWVEIFVQG
mmetsp:Transcript_8611/g.16886  ORF Transcript_8611/g.16886 Transcript_8611/m.16886 type:complete len:336 (+) Transcript_8611:700-1707(+)|eukprot:CAMPEP_0204905452 /NCGR_PEP_ID=MMETSP1397-20131031/5428_1 /ASSEMBLY_ACC=CAM_ASM_000891 /TAXON_ID=49980 /ORGANISM="Climacostomum Climacostomum virens, Strain Stock W-24" /LENGTH=335 /DNA_ID=CAMNT_0052074335 /DNA_START=701 /DNA_END=1708 /DNA_ORIENTATION=-